MYSYPASRPECCGDGMGCPGSRRHAMTRRSEDCLRRWVLRRGGGAERPVELVLSSRDDNGGGGLRVRRSVHLRSWAGTLSTEESRRRGKTGNNGPARPESAYHITPSINRHSPGPASQFSGCTSQLQVY